MKISASLSNVGETVSRKAELSLRPTNAMDDGFRSRSRAAAIDPVEPARDDAACIRGAVPPLEPVPTITRTSPFSGSFEHLRASRKLAGQNPGRQRSCAEHLTRRRRISLTCGFDSSIHDEYPSRILRCRLDEARWAGYHPSGNQYYDTAMVSTDREVSGISHEVQRWQPERIEQRL